MRNPFARADAHHLIIVWETTVKPELQREVDAFPEETQADKEKKALLLGFLDRVESRLVAHAVLDSMPPHVDKKPKEKFVTTA